MSCCTSFLVSIAGPWLAVSGAIFLSQVVINRLTDYVWIGRAEASASEHTIKVTRILCALRNAMDFLDKYYKSSPLSPPSRSASETHARYFPTATSYVDENGATVEFRHDAHLKP